MKRDEISRGPYAGIPPLHHDSCRLRYNWECYRGSMQFLALMQGSELTLEPPKLKKLGSDAIFSSDVIFSSDARSGLQCNFLAPTQ